MIGVIGYGVVGSNTGRMIQEMGNEQILHYDRYKKGSNATLTQIIERCDTIFICLPTPMRQDGSNDLSYAFEAIDQIVVPRTLVLRSTVIPGTCDRLSELYPQHEIIFCPEFLTEADPWKDTRQAKRVVLGMTHTNENLVNLFLRIYKDKPIIHMTLREAEAYKYACNAMLAMQVLAANEVCFALESMGVDYSRIQPWLRYDGRIGSHTLVPGPDGDYGYGGKCFPKDVEALAAGSRAAGYDAPLLSFAIEFNKSIRNNHDWIGIPGAVTECGYETDS